MKTKVLLCMMLLAMSLPLSADITITTAGVPCGTSPTAGLCSPFSGAHPITFDTWNGQLLPQTDGIAEYNSLGGSGSPFVTGSASGEYAAPGTQSADPLRHDETTYLTVGSPSRPTGVEITFLVPIAYFGFYMGSPDNYNNVTFEFFNNSTPIVSKQGSDLIPPGSQSWAVGEYLNFWVKPGDSKITKIRMTSTQAAFETDNHAYFVPEPVGLFLTVLMSSVVFCGRFLLRRARVSHQ